MGMSRGLARSLVAASVALLAPATADAAELVVTETGGIGGEVVVERGKDARFALLVSAAGDVTCSTGPGSGVGATVNTRYAVAGGQVTQSSPSRFLRFYANRQNAPLPIGDCPVAWDGSPTPYTVDATVTAAPDSAIGTYTATVQADPQNPSLSFLGPLDDATPATLNFRVKVTLPPASERGNRFNLKPVSGQVFVAFPRGPTLRVTEPQTAPEGSIVNAINGRVDLVADSNGFELEQTAEFREGRFRVSYSRQLVPTLPQRASRPFTELRVLGSVPRSCRGGHARPRSRASRHLRSRRRRLWGRGRGRYRTRGRYGAATARGTHWLLEESCRGTFGFVRDGRVSFRDFSVDRTFSIPAGRGYLAAPPHATDVRG
jgi:hypothetical protein